MAKVGRPTKMTPEAVERFLRALRGGNFRYVAAQWAGIHPRVVRAWMQEGRKNPKSEHGSFLRQVIEAEQSAEILMVGRVMQAAAEDARHAEWWLERKHNARWGRKDVARLEHTGKNGSKLEFHVDLRRADEGKE